MASRSGPKELTASEPVVRSFLAGRLRGSELEDATQTVMQRALERREAYEAADRPRAWLLGVARNVAFEVLRARARAPVPTEEVDLAGDPLRVPFPTAEDQLNELEEHNQLYQALDGLRLEDQLALLMTYVDGLPGPQAAEMLGVSFPAFRQRLSRARRQAEQRIRELAETPIRVDPLAIRAWQRLLEPRSAGEQMLEASRRWGLDRLRVSSRPSEQANAHQETKSTGNIQDPVEE
ncbi:MAG: sigma-70 family RNA polymerase sigma factor [Myxococcales bacterium]|nr:sigma-70 family RNA polymerase sigma factor [Myxococcales bacterium]